MTVGSCGTWPDRMASEEVAGRCGIKPVLKVVREGMIEMVWGRIVGEIDGARSFWGETWRTRKEAVEGQY